MAYLGRKPSGKSLFKRSVSLVSRTSIDSWAKLCIGSRKKITELFCSEDPMLNPSCCQNEFRVTKFSWKVNSFLTIGSPAMVTVNQVPCWKSSGHSAGSVQKRSQNCILLSLAFEDDMTWHRKELQHKVASQIKSPWKMITYFYLHNTLFKKISLILVWAVKSNFEIQYFYPRRYSTRE